MAQENAIAKTEAQRRNTLMALLEEAKPKLMETAPKHMKVDRMIRLLLTASSRNPKILDCTNLSVMQFAMKCSETGLEPIGAGGCWPIPYMNNKARPAVMELTFIPDYRGLVNCAKHAGCIKDAYAEVVKENDEFDYSLGLEPALHHKPARGDRGELEAVYCVMVFPDDTRRFIVMEAKDIAAIRSRSRASSSGPWVSDTAEMWKKTVIRRAMKPFAGMSSNLDAAIEADDAASGIELREEKEPIQMPKAIGETEPPKEESPEQKPDPADPEVSKDTRMELDDEFLRLKMPAKDIAAACKAVGARGVGTLRQSQAEALLENLRSEVPNE